MTNADWQVDNCKEMLSKLVKTVSRLEEYLNVGIGMVTRSFHIIFYLVYLTCQFASLQSVFAHTAIFEAGILSFLGLNFLVQVRVQLKSFCKREKVGHLECAFQKILPRFD